MSIHLSNPLLSGRRLAILIVLTLAFFLSLSPVGSVALASALGSHVLSTRFPGQAALRDEASGPNSPHAAPLAADLRAELINNAETGVALGGAFHWMLYVGNLGADPVVFADDQVILRDQLPAGPVYGAPGRSDIVSITNSANINCSIVSNTLTCSASGASVTIGPSGLFYVRVPVIPQALGILVNPAPIGICAGDPDNVILESDESNNSCSNSIEVKMLPILRGHHVYITNTWYNAIDRGNLEGGGATHLGNPGTLITNPRGVAVDSINAKLYIASYGSSRIIRSNLDGTGGTDLGNLGGLLSAPIDIALDVPNHTMYIVSSNNKKLVRANLDGSGGASVADLGMLSAPISVALDLVHGKIFITGMDSNNVVKMNLDGSGVQNLGNPGSLLNHPEGIDLDVPNNQMYIANYATSKVVRVNLDGTQPTDLGNPGGLVSGPGDLALDLVHRKMYIASWVNSRSVQANLDGSEAVNLYSGTSIVTPWGMALDLSAPLYLPFVRR